MRIARVATSDGPKYAVERGPEWALVTDPFASVLTETGVHVPRENATLLPPAEPTVIIGMAHNGSPENRQRPAQAFLKSARTLAGPGDVVSLDPALGRVVLEGELAIVVGREARHLTEENALEAVLGYTVANNVSATDQAECDSLLTQAKNGEGFSPLGPWIETMLDPFDATIRVEVNGERRAESSTDSWPATRSRSWST